MPFISCLVLYYEFKAVKLLISQATQCRIYLSVTWYPYTEGFSKPFVERVIKEFGISKEDLVLDPFGGCGTTSLACTLNGINSASIEVNPFMCLVARVKTDLGLDTKKLDAIKTNISEDLKTAKPYKFNSNHDFLTKPFFTPNNLNQLLIIKNVIESTRFPNEQYKDFFKLAIASLLIKISNMKRGPDLRYKEPPYKDLDISRLFIERMDKFISDVRNVHADRLGRAHIIEHNIMNNISAVNLDDSVDFFITSPPYLNGTNYIRNTKLELWYLDYVKSTNDLKTLRKAMITAGINDTQSDKKYDFDLEITKGNLDKLFKVAYDKRIPKMIEFYFKEMLLATRNIHNMVKKGGKGVIVIGDSQFAGVHIPTDTYTADICHKVGFRVDKQVVARERRSKNGMALRESLIYVTKV